MDTAYLQSTETEELAFIKESAKNFAEKYIREHVMEWDEAQHFPKDLFAKMGEQGFMGVLVPEEFGGSGLGYQAYITIIEEITKACSSIGLSLAAQLIRTNHILMFGNDEQKKKYLPKLASGEHVGFWGPNRS